MLKKTFLTTINANYVIAMKIGKFSIPDKIKNNYKIVGDISNIENWKAKVILGNNTDADKIGTFDDVGYVGFKPSTGTLVPIARGDEHHTGYELLDELKEKGLIPKGTYYTLCTVRSQLPPRRISR